MQVTSQDHEHPAMDLVEQLTVIRNNNDLDPESQLQSVGVHSGWHTQRFCIYP